jgi:hypothetical protein
MLAVSRRQTQVVLKASVLKDEHGARRYRRKMAVASIYGDNQAANT